ncbi:MAG: hypothetical protein L3J36_09595 [Rhodobacteraceae bacterium]|nr:hypothetical protein [Paracoccaceae bacterium]
MKNVILVVLSVAILSSAAPVVAGVIDRACRKADRTAASPQLCSCIQKVANSSLSFVERRKVAKWFDDPHSAQVTRQSDKRSDEDLWLRYRAFGELAQASCK